MNLANFTTIMEMKLVKNAHKDWRNEQPAALLLKLLDEVEELTTEMEKPLTNVNATLLECADIANFAFMIAARLYAMQIAEARADKETKVEPLHKGPVAQPWTVEEASKHVMRPSLSEILRARYLESEE